MIQIENLSKTFTDKPIINSLNLKIENGEIVALVGHNGSGKSTLIRLIAGLLEPDSGHIRMSGNKKVGVLLGGDVNLYANLTGIEIINFYANIRGMKMHEIQYRIQYLDEIIKFKSFMNKKAYTFSRGMRQKIAIVLSVIHDPDIILLDEPSTGLDITTENEIINFMRFLKTQNKTILIATHNIFEISDLSTSIAFLKNGYISKMISTKAFFENCEKAFKSNLLISELNIEEK